MPDGLLNVKPDTSFSVRVLTKGISEWYVACLVGCNFDTVPYLLIEILDPPEPLRIHDIYKITVPDTWMYCKTCNAPREGEQCWKCNGDTTKPCEGWSFTKLPDINKIRVLAKEVGYAIGIHGSRERDLDIVAMPWVEEAVTPEKLFEHIAKGMNARVVDKLENKPVGRIAATIQIDGYYKQIDISVMPPIPSNKINT